MWLLIYLIFCNRDTRLCCNIDCKKKKNSFYSSFSRFKYLFLSKKKIRRTNKNAYRLNRLNRDIFQDMFFCQTILNRKKRRVSVLKYFCRFSHFSSHSLFFFFIITSKGDRWIKSQEEEISKEKSILWIPLSKACPYSSFLE